MNVLVIGSGGREHALCWSIAASPLLTKLWCAPGNPGIAAVATCVPIGAIDLAALVSFARDHAIDLVVPGPEASLVAGVADAMAAAGIACCGPTQAAARSKAARRSPSRSATPPAFRPPAGSGSRTPRQRANSSVAVVRRSW